MLKIPWPSGYGAAKAFEALGADQRPTRFLVDRNGMILWRGADALDEAIQEELRATQFRWCLADRSGRSKQFWPARWAQRPSNGTSTPFSFAGRYDSYNLQLRW